MAAALQPDARDPVRDAEQLDVAAVGLHVRPHAVQRLLHARLQRDRVEPVHQHQAGDDAVVDEAAPERIRALLVDGREDPLQPLAVQLHQRRGELLAGRPELSDELLDAALGVHPQQRPVGVCITFRTLPLPVYMCTPHGRHGSNEWTARMMSTPLKSSGPFSSKIGVFCTASS